MARIPQTKIEEIESASDIVSVIARYVSLKKAGKNFKGLCPFHKEKTPSFIVSPEKQIYHCFGCGKGGNVFNFLMSVENLSYIESVKRIASDLGITIPDYRSDEQKASSSEYDFLYKTNQIANEYFSSQLFEPARKYLENRKLKKETLIKYSVGSAPNKWDGLINHPKFKSVNKKYFDQLGLIQKKDNSDHYYDRFRNRIIFPFFNLSGQIVGFGGRRLNENDQPKYLNSPESKIYKKGEILYGLHQAISSIREKKAVIIVEGYFDLLRLVDFGIQNVVASSGTALSESQGRLIKRYTDTAIFSYDSDEAGIKAAIRNSQILETLDLHVSMVLLPKPHDPDSFILQEGRAAFIELIKSRVTPIDYQLNLLQGKSKDLSLDEKNKLIDDLLENYLDIPNEVRIGLYLHKISDKFEIAESFLISRFNKLKKRDRYRIKTDDTDSGKPESFLKKGQWRAEEDLISILLLEDTEVSNYIFEHISISDFANEHLQKIFELLTHQYEELGHFDFKEIEKSLTTEMEMNTFSKLTLQVINNPLKYSAGCIHKMRKWHLDSRYNEILRLMKEEAASAKSKSHYTKELTDIRQRLTEIENEQNKFLKIDL
jgi:DNA primase